ncbi:MAG: hypothetical protein ACI4F2_08425 [Acutalibacteraceae bacterium]
MENLNSLHLDIAEVLTQCAKDETTISYGELCKRVGYNSPRTMGAVLDPLTKLTYKEYGVFISVLVVRSETQDSELPMPSDGFFAVYNETFPANRLNKQDIVKTQRELAYKQDWSELPELIRREINFNAD